MRAALRLALTRCQPGDVMLFATGTSVAELVDALRDFDPASADMGFYFAQSGGRGMPLGGLHV